MSRTEKPIREEAMKGYSGGPKAKHLIKRKDDNTLRDAFEMSKHGREVNKRIPLSQMDPDYLQNEIDGFVQYCIDHQQVPSKVGLSVWLGTTVNTIRRWEGDGASPLSTVLKSFTDFCHKFLEQKALDGEMHPVLFMFYSKNWFGLSDKTEIVHKSQSTQVIDITEQQRILRSAPGIVVDAEFTEQPENLAIGNSENLDTQIPENLGTHTQTEDLETILMGSENLETPENLDTFPHTHDEIVENSDISGSWDDDL